MPKVYCEGRDCPECQGTGEFWRDGIGHTCGLCNGRGKTPCEIGELTREIRLLKAAFNAARGSATITISWLMVSQVALSLAVVFLFLRMLFSGK